MIEWLLVPGAYLLGSISSAIIVCRVMGLPDPRAEGSGNPGATNVMRIGGKKAAAITLLGDMLKGLIPVLLAQLMEVEPLILAAVVLAAFLGHLYPIFFGFAGGKGVATSFGVLLGANWMVGLAVLISWITIYKLFKISSLSALVAASLAPVYVYLIMGMQAMVYVAALIAVILIWRHKTNIQRLLAGEEN
ncbi:glycerol-3-phosphate acyltransferase PlsY [Bathymodiolus platifrons methanotrophic gill symbiont]|uniref:glycerol-3-phosphate 1-O-acyltransferase PlsY n=1 Tax=Bathymodiolus platifrons methanotrophic gill symbiont TaxID=113268 RepID=UPI000B41ED43|nr:glycerol-3-phosphate 1-O-acyltransferase PlsY [Bathymodiolus platifrons methanotrophic gill symbiont]TXL14057.1 acyl-phosphate glycerol 3-phosphate acyltransferase [Methylococcaceae bacterium HT4]TXL17833.1 acyl-phosphate glycerol 3-phosphate acyltransferase [Methylococcaceae bacterium HT3]TXL20765.1 acyl-phosphate glycerol 3-phosphate acyltransferase [Methylococcaceae bacterium HT5]GAW84956.1 glycerol-3-phosphate acyltransferase PlsY [Bathymodiolus platifrons methanotrophic gill symbiont]G